MQRSLSFGLVLLSLVVSLVLWLWWRDGGVAPPTIEPSADVATIPADVVAADGGREDHAVVREAAAFDGVSLGTDPVIQQALCGFRGRVVTHDRVPVADCGVRMYRFAADSVLRSGYELFGDLPAYEPQYIAAEVRTAADGTFVMRGVWPRAVFLMHAGIGTDAPTHQLVTQTPSAAQIVDLGDVVLNDAGVIVGKVLDAEGEPLAGAWVRCADVPGAFAAFFPIERFDPAGVVLVREPGSPVSVVCMPPWVERAIEHLPIPQTRSGPDGSFRLVGVVPGSNMLATSADAHLSDVKPAVIVRAGQEKDVGTIRLRSGEELLARVVDERGEPVVGAEVVAGSTLSVAPVDLGRHVGRTDRNGEVLADGFAPGKVTVAARRSARDAWVLAEPQSIITDVVVTLPAQLAVTVSVRTAAGELVDDASLQLLAGREGAAEMVMLGFRQPLSLEGRLGRNEQGALHITGLDKGVYTLLAERPGNAIGRTSFELSDRDLSVTVALGTVNVFAIRVVDFEGAPVRNAAIRAKPAGESLIDMPVDCGRTDADGRLVIDRLEAETLRVSAEHPAYGFVHGEVDGSAELVLQMQQPGGLHGVLTENGESPLPGRFTLVVARRDGSGPSDQLPQLVTAGFDGEFVVRNLQPGTYSVSAINSLDTLRSPGMAIALAQSVYLDPRTESAMVEVASGQVAEVQIDAGEKRLEGPVARLFGTVLMNGRVAAGDIVVVHGGGRRFAEKVDERGRFEFAEVPAGRLDVSVFEAQDGMMVGMERTLFRERLELAAGEARELIVDVLTSSVAGRCLLPDGSPAAGVRVRADRRSNGASLSRRTNTDDQGVFSLDGLPTGTWRLVAESRRSESKWRSDELQIDVVAGLASADVVLQLRSAEVVRGRVDLSQIEGASGFGVLTLTARQGDSDRRWRERLRRGRFELADLPDGLYSVELTVMVGREMQQFRCADVLVTAGSAELVVVPIVR